MLCYTIQFLKETWHHEEAKGFLTYRVADRRGDHSDHRGHRNSEPPPVPYGRQRGFGSRFSPHHQHRGSDLFHYVPERRFCRDDWSAWRDGTLHDRTLNGRLPD